jgi:hypothetical protein
LYSDIEYFFDCFWWWWLLLSLRRLTINVYTASKWSDVPVVETGGWCEWNTVVLLLLSWPLLLVDKCFESLYLTLITFLNISWWWLFLLLLLSRRLTINVHTVCKWSDVPVVETGGWC